MDIQILFNDLKIIAILFLCTALVQCTIVHSTSIVKCISLFGSCLSDRKCMCIYVRASKQSIFGRKIRNNLFSRRIATEINTQKTAEIMLMKRIADLLFCESGDITTQGIMTSYF